MEDIIGSIFLFIVILVAAIIVLFIVFLPSIITIYFSKAQIKSKKTKRFIVALSILSNIVLLVFLYNIIPSGFGPEYETVEIKQKIGGKLICESIYNADIHSWQYYVVYKYIDSNGDTLDFKNGTYYGREWKKNEQIKKYNEWLILKSGAWHGSDRLIIKNSLTDSTFFFDIDNQFIEKDSLWNSRNINSLLNFCCAETFIDNIKGNKISLTYKFRSNKKLTNKYDKRKIVYEFDNKTGEIKMKNIK